MSGGKVEDIYGLAPLQEGILFHCLYGQDPSLYVTLLSCTLVGLDPDCFEQAWQGAVERHPCLRTGFVWEGLEQPVQVVARTARLPWEVADWSGLAPEEQAEQLLHAETEEPARLGRLNRAPLLRCRLIRLGPDRHRFLFCHHHLVLDGWSLPLLLGEVFRAYASLVEGREPVMTPARPFRELIAWLRQRDSAAAQTYWQEVLADCPQAFRLGCDRGEIGQPVGSTSHVEDRLAPDEAGALSELVRSRGLTLGTALQAAWGLVLARASGEWDLTFGLSVAGRPAELPGVERMVGPLTNTVPCRLRIDPRQPVEDWLRAHQDAQARQRPFEHSALSQVQKWSQASNGRPLFEPILLIENYPLPRDLGQGPNGLALLDLRLALKTSCPLLAAAKPGADVVLTLTFDRDRFTAAQAAGLLRAWHGTLAGLSVGAARSVGEVPWWSAAERHQLLVEWNDTGARAPAAELVCHRIAHQARRSPDAVALVDGERSLTYGHLARQVARLAARLTALGLGPEQLVGIHLGRSIEAMLAILGVLEAGGAYLPFDPAYPAERLDEVWRDARPVALVSSCSTGAQPPGWQPPQGFRLDIAELLAATPSPSPARPAPPDPGQLAYVLYTSGSTGRPKGVAIEHRSLALHVQAEAAQHRIVPGDRVLQFASLSFDVSLEEIFVTLTQGAKLVLRQEWMLESAATFLRACEQLAITILAPPTAFWAELAAEPGPLPPGLRRTVIAGEAAQPESALRWGARIDGAGRLINAYGPTEATIYALASDLTEATRAGQVLPRVPIGRPLPHRRALVLGRDGQPVIPGGPGELLLGGIGLARGYMGRPAATAERFVPDPFGGGMGDRLYRTGDRVRQWPDGQVEFLGRLDRQLKIRGFRIEPGEIEAHLVAHPEVAAGAVEPTRGPDGRLRLTAFAAVGEATVSPQELRRHLAERLPDYLVPNSVVVLATLPNTTAGKLDRRALASLAERAGSEEVVPERSANSVEAKLLEAWTRVLRRDRVGLHDSFFDLGGDSILSIQLVARAREAGLKLTPQQIFEHRTVAALAEVATPLGSAVAWQPAAPGPVPLTPIAARFFAAEGADPHHFNQALTLRLRKPLQVARLSGALLALVRHHDAFQLRFERSDGAWRSRTVGPQGAQELTAVDLSGLGEPAVGAEIERVCGAAQARLDLARGPLLRALLLHLPAGQGERLVLVAHHLVIDGVSWRILLEDLAVLLADPAAGLPRSVAFAQWSARLAGHAAGPEVAAELPLWQTSVPERLADWPVDDPTAESTYATVDSVRLRLDAAATERLQLETTSRLRATLEELMLAGLASTLARWSGHEEVWIDLENHGREPFADDLALERTVGWFTVIHPLRLSAPRGTRAVEALRRVKEELRRLPRRGLSYSLLTFGPQGGPALAAHPQPRLVFNYLGQLDASFGPESPFDLAPESTGSPISPRRRREHWLEVNAGIREGQLELSWLYDRQLHGREVVLGLGRGLLEALEALSDDLSLGAMAPSDFPLAALGDEALQCLLSTVEGEVEEIYPLSPLQQGMFFHCQLEPTSDVYFTQLACRIEGPLDGLALRRSWQQALDRHPALRTGLRWRDLDQPLQVVWRQVELPWQELDLRASPAGELDHRFSACLESDRGRPFELDRPPLVRCTLVRTGDQEWRFVLSIHHLVIDGWSETLLFAEVFAAYSCLTGGTTPPPSAAPRFSSYIAWLGRQRDEDPEPFWRQELEGLTAATPLGLDRRAGADRAPSTRGYSQRQLVLPATLTAGLDRLARSHDLTLSTVLVGLWGLLLGRLSGERDVVFGLAVSGRPADLPGAQLTVGCFLNTLPVRVRSEAGPLIPWLRDLQTRLLTARRQEHTPLVDIQGWTEVPRGQPLFESLVVIETFPFESVLGGALADAGVQGLRVELLHSFDRVSYPLALQVIPGETLNLRLKHDPARFELDTLDSALSQLAHLIEQAVSSPDQPLESLRLRWKGDGLPDPAAVLAAPSFEPVGDRVRSLARLDPGAVAVHAGGRDHDYARLWRAAEGIAHALVAAGLERGAVVAIEGEPSFGLVAALLAAFASGGVALPLDGSLPIERQRLMVREAQARLLLHVGTGASELAGESLEVLEVGSEDGLPRVAGRALEAAPPGPGSDPAAPAYVFFTSGTTAVPKAVLGRHQGLAHFIAWQRETFEVGAGDRVAQLTGLSFDVVLRDLFLPLTSGATLVVPPPGLRLDPSRVIGWLAAAGITRLHAVPSLAQAWLEAHDPSSGGYGGLRTVFFAGEPLSDTLVRRWREVFPGCEVINLYGPTETTLARCWHRVEADPAPGVQPVGRPLPESQALVLAEGRLCGIGEPGEIALRTPFRTLGYLNAEEETRQRFVPNPYTDDPKDRLYLTGDRGRFRPDGALEILGRMDHQVKILGVRIDPNEVAAVLGRHPKVAAAAVVALTAPGRGPSLAAYVVARDPAPSLTRELREHALRCLPAAAVPATFTFLADLPITANGKLDRKALPEPTTMAMGAPEGPGLAPFEAVVAGVFREVLKRDPIGPRDSFFELGGHSLLAVQVISRLRTALGVDLPLAQLFEGPSVAEVAAGVEALLRTSGRAPSPPLEPAPDGEPPVLSFAQERLWFLDQVDPRNPLYNLHSAVRLRGRIEPWRLSRSLRRTAARHVVLRSGFLNRQGRAHLTIVPPGPFELPCHDLSGLDRPALEAELAHLGELQAGYGFDLSRPPLVRAVLLRLGPDEHALLMTLHHAIADAWTLGLLLRELSLQYRAADEAEPEDGPAALPDGGPRLDYTDYARWQRRWATAEQLEGELGFWRRQLAGAPETTLVPGDRPRPTHPTHTGGRWVTTWPTSLAERLTSFAQRGLATPFMALMAASSGLLLRLSGQQDQILGTAVAGRNRQELESILGLFVNSLPIRVDVPARLGLGERLVQVRRQVLAAYAHQDLPFEKIVEAHQVERNAAYNPIFQVMLVVQNAPHPEPLTGEVLLEPLNRGMGTARLDLTFSVTEREGGLEVLVDYARDLYDLTTVVRLVGQLRTLIEHGLAHPATPLEGLPVLSPGERQQLLEWNDRSADVGPMRCLHQLFEAQAGERPDAIAALAAGGDALSYGELDRRANRLAWELAARGVGPERLVAIALPRGFDMLVAVLGVLKAGGAYLPLDPSYPRERLSWMLEDARPTALVTSAEVLTALPETPAPSLLVDRDRALLEARSSQPWASSVGPEHLAYVIYTSGSTGRPRGVLIEHRGVVNTLACRRLELGISPRDCLLQNISLSFDPSVWQIFGALVHGARLALATGGEHQDPEALFELITRTQATIADFPPSLLRALLEHRGFAGSRLRLVFAGGEALPPAVRDRFLQTFGEATLVNVYGPTETSIDASFWRCRSGETGDSVPIGRPIVNKRLLVLDPRLRRLPIGAAGQLAIAGAGLARGYLGRPGYTADRFRPCEDESVPGARIYLTGDLVRTRADGALEFLGRIDLQVKVRGVRIELGEVEAALLSHPSVMEAAVVARTGRGGEQRLEAFAVATSEGCSERDLADHLHRLLPAAMIPAVIALLPELPRTPAGKVDRAALRASEPERGRTEGTFTGPRNPREALLAEIWAEVLGRPRVGVDDNFFEIGGDSILSIQIVARASHRGLRLTPRQIFLHQTVAELAAVAEEGPSEPMAEQGPVVGPAPLSPIQRWFFELEVPEPSRFNQSVRLAVAPGVPVGKLARALARLLAHHDALRLCFRSGPDGPEQAYTAPGGPLPFGRVDLSGLAEIDAQSRADSLEAAAQGSLDLGSGRLLRALSMKLPAGDPERLTLIVHHLAVDGVSWRILIEDLERLCNAKEPDPSAASLPAKTTSFGAWARALGEPERLAALELEIEPWLAGLAGAPSRLPLDFPREGVANLEEEARTVKVEADEALTSSLVGTVCERFRARIDEVLLSAFSRAVAAWSGQQWLRLELEGHGREQDGFEGVDLTRTVGWFTSIYPVRLSLPRDSDPIAHLRAIKDQLRAVPGRGFGFGLLRYLGRQELVQRLAGLPPPEITFNYLGQLAAGPASGSLRLLGEAAGSQRSTAFARRHLFDLNGLISGGRLRFTWRYCPRLHRPETVEALAGAFLAELSALREARLDPGQDARTVSDFPLIQGNQPQLDRLLRRFGQAGKRKGS
ncbi:MAG TPA: amino acid adenylation domain-containing protein [Thermoanaerobaculia bacterium]|nr:amino acid adenylation domain-containing protein [Thermoanaerobaculia bacterium]